MAICSLIGLNRTDAGQAVFIKRSSMYFNGIVEGKFVNLKSVTVDDAEFTRNIRLDPDFAKFFPPLNITLEQQKQWIENHQTKEGDYFFVVWDKEGNRIGTISVYDFADKCCESGRLAIKGNAFQSTEAQMLIFKFAFEILGMETVVGYIFADNERAIRFNKQFGCVLEEPEIHDNGHMMVKATYTREAVEKATERIKKMMYR